MNQKKKNSQNHFHPFSIKIFLLMICLLFGLAASLGTSEVPEEEGCDGANYSYLRKWGAETEGSEALWFIDMTGIAIYNGYIYVTDSENHRIQRFNNSTWIQWGTYAWSPSNPGEFNTPIDIDIDSQGIVYVADIMDRVSKFDADGNYITQFTTDGHGAENYGGLRAIAVNSSGEVYAVNEVTDRASKYDASGNLMFWWGGYGSSSDGFFNNPQGIAVDNIGYVYVADTNNCRIQKFDADGNFEGWWGKDDLGVIGWHGALSNRSPSCASDDGALYYPTGICTDNDQNVYVTDRDNNRIQKFDAWGQYITKWGSQGSNNSQLDNPWGITVDKSSCQVYIADQNNNRVMVLEKQ